MPHDLNPTALSAAQAAGEATYMAATDDREALPQAIEAAILRCQWRKLFLDYRAFTLQEPRAC